MSKLKNNNILALLIFTTGLSSSYANSGHALKTEDLITFYNEEQSFLYNLLNDQNSYISDKKIVNEEYVKPKFEQHYKYSNLLNYKIYNNYLSSDSSILDKELVSLTKESSQFKCKKLKKDKFECLYNELQNNIKIQIINAVKQNESSEEIKKIFSGDIENKAYTYFKGIIIENNKK
ncbi:TPA: hypothetical protein NV714_002027 [Escherichia coli]|nr:hypothetical protein [Escherichia coli]